MLSGCINGYIDRIAAARNEIDTIQPSTLIACNGMVFEYSLSGKQYQSHFGNIDSSIARLKDEIAQSYTDKPCHHSDVCREID